MRWIIAVVVVLVVLIGAGCTPQEQQVVTDNLGSLPDAARLALVEQTEGFLQPEAPIIRFTDPLQVVNPGLLNHVYSGDAYCLIMLQGEASLYLILMLQEGTWTARLYNQEIFSQACG